MASRWGGWTLTEDWFMDQYMNPTETIDFSVLKDGTTFATAERSGSRQIRTYNSGGGVRWYEVRETAWSNRFSLSSMGFCGGVDAKDATVWRSSGVSSSCREFGITLLGELGPVALNSGASFIGLIPEGPTDVFYRFGGALTLVRTGFIEVQQPSEPIPEPATWAMVGIGLCALTIGRRRSSAPQPTS